MIAVFFDSNDHVHWRAPARLFAGPARAAVTPLASFRAHAAERPSLVARWCVGPDARLVCRWIDETEQGTSRP